MLLNASESKMYKMKLITRKTCTVSQITQAAVLSKHETLSELLEPFADCFEKTLFFNMN